MDGWAVGSSQPAKLWSAHDTLLMLRVCRFTYVQMETIRQHIRAFKADNGLDKVVVLWTANTERYAQVRQ